MTAYKTDSIYNSGLKPVQDSFGLHSWQVLITLNSESYYLYYENAYNYGIAGIDILCLNVGAPAAAVDFALYDAAGTSKLVQIPAPVVAVAGKIQLRFSAPYNINSGGYWFGLASAASASQFLGMTGATSSNISRYNAIGTLSANIAGAGTANKIWFRIIPEGGQ